MLNLVKNMNKNKFHVIHDRTLSLFVAISEFAKYSDNSSRIKTESTESAVDFGRIFPLSVNSSIFVKKDIRNNVGFNGDSFELGKGGMDVTVNGHTQLNGAVITSNADADHNKLNTQTIRATEIKNHSELKTESAAVGTGAMAAMTMAMSALGNQHDTNYSSTKSAVGANIALMTEDKNAQNINRNTENTNEKVKKQDLAKAQENQEAAKLVGEIASNLVGIYTFKEREAIEKAKLEVGKLQADAKEKGISQEDLEKSTVYQKAQQNLTALQASYDDNYGIGSTKGRAIQAVTAALQGIAGGRIEQAAVGLASPYLNEQIKQWTTDKDGNVDKTANLAAHAILGALEAQVTGNNALAGAAAATTGEAAAMVITNTLYNGKKAEELTENEKQNVVFLSQVASGLASTFIANDGTASAAMGSEIGKRAVENNAITPETAWDVANIAIGTTSLVYNVNEGNYGSAVIDAVGLIYDSFATAVPFLPAGVSAGLDAYRVGNTAKQSVVIGSDVAKATKAADAAAKDSVNIMNNAAITGTKIHRATGDSLGESYGYASKLSDSANSYFKGANKSTGKQPDLSWSGTKVWSDLTTPNQWGAHIRKYEQHYGYGIPILYKPNVGVINTQKLPVGAGSLNGGAELYKIATDKQEQ